MEDPEERKEPDLDLLFSPYYSRDQRRDLRSMADYFEYVADQIDHKRRFVAVSPKLLKRFEAAYLMLRQIFSSYPETVQKQAESICEGLSLEKLFAALVIDQPDRRRFTASPIEAFFSGITAIMSNRDLDQGHITENSLLNAKIALGRLAQLALYASSIPLEEPDDDDDGFRDHYDPDLADKGKIFALLSILRTQANNVSDASIRGKILLGIEKIEVEVKKPKPRWKKALAIFFLLIGFLADLKTLDSKVYEPLYKTAQILVSVLHEEGTVEHHRRTPFTYNGIQQELLEPPKQDFDEEAPK